MSMKTYLRSKSRNEYGEVSQLHIENESIESQVSFLGLRYG